MPVEQREADLVEDDPVEQAEITRFLHREADLLDRREFDAWFALFTEDCCYWIPAGADAIDPTRQVSIVYDDHRLLGERVSRFGGGLAYAQEPASRTARLVSNILLGEHREDDTGQTTIEVAATFLVAEYRRRATNVYAGRASYRLRRTPDGLRIQSKKVDLINNAGHLGNLSLPL